MRIAAAGLGVVVLGSSIAVAERPKPATVEEAGRQRVERQRAVAEVAPGPTAGGLPLVGQKGHGPDGAPAQHVDRVAVRALLRARRYAELTRHLEALQAAFEADPRDEEWPMHFGSALSTPEPELAPLLEEWVQATPKSFAPYFARGAYRVAVGWARRGGDLAANTHETDFAAMRHAHRQALVDLERAVELRPRLVAALREEINIFKAGSERSELDRALTRAIEACPTCLAPRVAYIHALEPRWGGTYDEMAAFARGAPIAKNPRLRILSGLIELDKAKDLRRAKQDAAALTAVERACATGEDWRFLVERAELLFSIDRARARRDLERALVLAPFEDEVLYARAWLASAERDYERAGRELLAGLRVDPTNHAGKAYFPSVIQGLVYQSNELRKQAKLVDAMRVIELATDLDPRNRDAQGLRIWLLTHGPDGAPLADIEALRAQLKTTPDDLRAHQRVDYLLAQKRRFDEVVEVWNGYITRHPEDGRALLERGGAYFNLGRRDAAMADARRACELGVSEGCARSKGTP